MFLNFRRALLSSFDDQLKARAFVVAEKTNIQPKIIPLPQGDEVYTIIYISGNKYDTLFKSVRSVFDGRDSISANKGWRAVTISQSLENGGSLRIIFALPSSGIEKELQKLELLFALVLPAGVILAALLAYWLSYTLIKPVKQVIDLANNTNINNNIELLDEPESANELKELIVSFNRMLLRIKDQSTRQTAFFASASHELRTPLSVMHTRLEILMKENNTPEINAVYKEQLKEVQRLTKMVNDFLLLSELRSGNMTVSKSICNLSEIVSDSLEKYRNKSAAKELVFKISYLPVETSYEIIADESKLQIIIDNLTDNAVKYAPEKSTIDVIIQKNNDEITLNIINEIRYDIKPMIADVKNEFYHSKPLHGEGFGLGLWISNQLALMQDLEIFLVIRDKKIFDAGIVMKT